MALAKTVGKKSINVINNASKNETLTLFGFFHPIRTIVGKNNLLN